MWKILTIFLCFSLSMTLNAQIKVLAFAGSTREESVNKKLVLEAVQIARDAGASVEFVDLKDYPMPFYDADLESEEGLPENAKKLRRLMIDSQVILIASPEYNGSVSALLKNTIDWLSRNESKGPSREAFKGKKIVIMSASPGGSGGSRGLVHLRFILEDLGGIVNSQIITVPDAYNAFDEKGNLKNPKLRSELQKVITESIQ